MSPGEVTRAGKECQKNKTQQLTNLHVNNCRGKESAVQFHPRNSRRFKYARCLPPVVTFGVWRIGKVVERDRARRVKRRISEGARIVIINLR